MLKPLPIPAPGTTVAVLICADAARQQRVSERCARLGGRVVAAGGDEPADLVIADADIAAATRRVKPGGTLAIMGDATSERLETVSLVLAEIDVVVCSPEGIRF
jgi:hypothetical protein